MAYCVRQHLLLHTTHFFHIKNDENLSIDRTPIDFLNFHRLLLFALGKCRAKPIAQHYRHSNHSASHPTFDRSMYQRHERHERHGTRTGKRRPKNSLSIMSICPMLLLITLNKIFFSFTRQLYNQVGFRIAVSVLWVRAEEFEPFFKKNEFETLINSNAGPSSMRSLILDDTWTNSVHTGTQILCRRDFSLHCRQRFFLCFSFNFISEICLPSFDFGFSTFFFLCVKGIRIDFDEREKKCNNRNARRTEQMMRQGDVDSMILPLYIDKIYIYIVRLCDEVTNTNSRKYNFLFI